MLRIVPLSNSIYFFIPTVLISLSVPTDFRCILTNTEMPLERILFFSRFLVLLVLELLSVCLVTVWYRFVQFCDLPTLFRFWKIPFCFHSVCTLHFLILLLPRLTHVYVVLLFLLLLPICHLITPDVCSPVFGQFFLEIWAGCPPSHKTPLGICNIRRSCLGLLRICIGPLRASTTVVGRTHNADRMSISRFVRLHCLQFFWYPWY